MIDIDLKECCKKCDFSRLQMDTYVDDKATILTDVFIYCINKPICKEIEKEKGE